MAVKLRTRRGDDKEPMQGKAAPYRRKLRAGPDPRPPEVLEALKDCHDLGECCRVLASAFPNTTEQRRLEMLRDYLRNLQFKWQDNPERKARERIARQNGVPFVAPDGNIDGERTADELAGAEDEIAQLSRDNFNLEQERDELEDKLEALSPTTKSGSRTLDDSNASGAAASLNDFHERKI